MYYIFLYKLLSYNKVNEEGKKLGRVAQIS
jgi:hypothetical protein